MRKKEPPMNPIVIPGKYYRHFKGKEYQVLAIARHTETLEELVIYQALYGEQNIWARPLAQFIETVERDNTIRPRFSLVAPMEEEKK